ncbi:hypothetical protein [Fulvivirga lutea]|uniref:Uncharacterized protein n=1 Tax=Fulvivirga lutea TaxID=2810512 RepID=A0A974WDW6_9BACT|nr:hypothetical protein [Fulvivirga lutea]QSE96151.1 hypothetical protein JR347_11055 [Fulvivirga lutea]
MARATLEIVDVLRKTATKLASSNNYQWGHMGSCNCGFLAQEITHYSSSDIHSRAMQKYGDWNEQLNDYCPTSGLLMDDLITTMLDFGFDSDDLKHLEKLSDKNVLQKLPVEERYLSHNRKADVVKYLKTWASMLEEQLIENINIEKETIKKPLKKVSIAATIA